MPLKSKRSRAAKQTRNNALAAFAKPAPHTTSPEGSEYVDSEDSVTDSETGDESEIQRGNKVGESVEALQHLDSTFLPPHLCPEEKGREKRRKIANRKAVYSGDSRTSIWRRESELKRAAEGCQTLDAFVVKKVRLLSVKQWRVK